MPKSPAERKAAERARKRKAGLVRFEEWVTPTERDKLMAALAELQMTAHQSPLGDKPKM